MSESNPNQSSNQSLNQSSNQSSEINQSPNQSPESNPSPETPNPTQQLVNTQLLDEDGHLLDHHQWTPDIAQQLANTLSLTLTPTHLEILFSVRDFYTRFEHAPATRPLIKFLSQQLPKLPINNAYLQQTFNTGLVARHLSRLAGLPKPANCL